MGGLFEEQRSINVSSAALPLTQEAPSLKEQAVFATLTNQSLSDVVISNATGGLYNRTAVARRYAKEHYPLGLPDTNTIAAVDPDNPQVVSAISDSMSLVNGCTVFTAIIRDLSLAAIVYPYLVANRGLERSAILGLTPFFNRLVVYDVPSTWIYPMEYLGASVVPELPYVENLTLSADYTTISIRYRRLLRYTAWNATELKFTTEYVPEAAYTPTFTESYTIPTGLEAGASYCIAEYQENDVGGNPIGDLKVWYYPMRLGLYPAIANINTIESSLYPVVPIRYNNNFITEVADGDLYTKGKVLLKKMGLSFDAIVDELDTNPDINDIDHAYMMMGVDVQTDNQAALRYLIKYFQTLLRTDAVSIFDKMTQALDNGSPFLSASAGVSLVYSENFEDFTIENILGLDLDYFSIPAGVSMKEYGLDLSSEMDSFTVVTEIGSIGDIGTVTKEITPTQRIETIVFGSNALDSQINVTYTKPVLILREQIDTNRYTEARISNLRTFNTIYKGYSVVTDLDQVQSNPDNHNMVIPLRHDIVRQSQPKERNELLANTQVLIVNAYDNSHVQWYATTAFTFLVTAIVTIVTFVYGGPYVGTLASTLTAIGVPAVISLLLSTTLFAATIQIRVVNSLFGQDAATVVALLSLASGGLQNFTRPVTDTALAVTKRLLFLGSLVTKVGDIIVSNKLNDVNAEYEDWMADAEAQQEVLDAKQELLEKEYLIPFSYFTTDAYYNTPDLDTSPERFYDKIHVGNIGTLSLSMVETYVDRQLLLPEANDTLTGG